MNENEARDLELVRAVEVEDREGALLTREDRAQALAYARAESAGLKGRRAERRFLAARAHFAASRLASRHPGLAGLLKRSAWPRWITIALPLIALAAGVLANEFGNDKRMDLLAVPLLGTIGWNLLVYLWILVSLFTGAQRRMGDPLVRGLARIGSLGERGASEGSAVQRAAALFRSRWAKASAPLAMARASRTLHLAAALFAIGLIGGIYGRALVIEYRAGWESTFLGPTMVHGLLSVILGPASAISGVAIPPVADIAAMRWTGPDSGGVNAAPWIHLYTVTLAGVVIVPRLLLSLWQGLRALRLSRNFPTAGKDDFYIRRLLRESGAASGRARVTPYAYHPGEETQRRLSAALREVLGDGAQVRFDEPIEYGAEDQWVAAHPADPDDDYHLLLFTLSATPEAENHGALAAALAMPEARRGKKKKAQSGTILGALVDESPYRAHFAGQAGLDERIATRLEGWRNVLAPAGITPLGVDLSRDEDGAMARRIEANLIPAAELGR